MRGGKDVSKVEVGVAVLVTSWGIVVDGASCHGIACTSVGVCRSKRKSISVYILAMTFVRRVCMQGAQECQISGQW